MSVGSLKTLYTTLQASPLLSGVSLAFGEESLTSSLELALPIVYIVPVGGVWTENGYAQGIDTDVNAIWMTTEQIDIYCYAYDTAPSAQPIDHADAVETVRCSVLQALMQQPATGLRFRPMQGAWVQSKAEFARYGRAYKLSVNVDISITDIAPVDAPTPLTVTVNASI